MKKINTKNVAETIGLKPSMVYKIKTGERFPSFKIMVNIEKKLGWTVNEQIASRSEGVYAKKFNEAIAARS